MTVLEEIRNGSDNVIKTHMVHFAIVCMMALTDMPKGMTELMLEMHPGISGKVGFFSRMVIPALEKYLEDEGIVSDLEKEIMGKAGESQPAHVEYSDMECGREK